MIIDEKSAVSISVRSLQLRSTPCEKGNIINECHGRCCPSTMNNKKSTVTILSTERSRIESLGALVQDNQIIADARKICPFQEASGLCSINAEKPFGCVAYPFELNEQDIFLLGTSFKGMRCYRNTDKYDTVPVYEAHQNTLKLIFGEKEAERIMDRVKSWHINNCYARHSFFAYMPTVTYKNMKKDAIIKKKLITKERYIIKKQDFNFCWDGLFSVN